MLARRLLADAAPAASGFRRRRPSDAAWPSQADWKRLNDAVGRNLIRVDSPISVLGTDADGADSEGARGEFEKSLLHRRATRLTQAPDGSDAWASKPERLAVAARNTNDVAAAALQPLRATPTCAWWSRAAVIAIRAHPMRPILFSSGRAT